ncbi:MAG: hypothetical protein AAF613_05310 [Pseudomonadota bacterium]
MKLWIAAASALALAPFASAVEVNVSFSEDFSEKLADDYGEKEGEYLSREITEDIEDALTEAGLSPARVDVTIIDAKPNRPTFEQLTDRPSLSATRSRSIGGMDLVGTAYDADGNALGTESYDWFQSDIRNTIAAATWTDAERTSRRFATRLAEALEN